MRTNAARLHAIAVEAAEQSERLTVPALHPPRPLAALLEAWPAERPLFAALAFDGQPAAVLDFFQQAWNIASRSDHRGLTERNAR